METHLLKSLGEKSSFREGPIARALERHARLATSELFFTAALGSAGVSALLFTMGEREESVFIGRWPATLLLLAVYNKLVRVRGSDRVSSEAGHPIRAG